VGFVGDAYAIPPRDDFRLHTIARLRSLVPSDMTAWVETWVGRPEVEAIASPRDLLPDGPRRFARIRDEHPVLMHFERSRHGGAAKLSDFMSPAQYHRKAIYQEFFRPAGIEHQISIALPSTGPRLIRITLNRARGDFTERDRLVLDLVRPHVAQAKENAAAFARLGTERRDLEQAAEAIHVGVVVVRDGRATYANARARKQLATYFAPGAPMQGRLPDALTAWLGMPRRPRGSGGMPPSRTPLVVGRGSRRLEIRALEERGGHILLLQERLTEIAPRPLESLGLTRRQAEVLAWLAEGKANIEIAAILAISPSTVARHVEAIFEKLGVRTRTAAAAAAFTRLASL
jgi:DNA-binding CsgD family transcriptional regulator